MIITQTSFDPQEGVANEWLLRHWDSANPDGVTEERLATLAAVNARVVVLFSGDTEVNAVLLERAEAAVLAANAGTITTAKNALRAAEGL